MQGMKCARCGHTEATMVIDGPFMIPMCPVCRKRWAESTQRSAILQLVSTFLGRAHPTMDKNLTPDPEAERKEAIRREQLRIASGYTKGMKP